MAKDKKGSKASAAAPKTQTTKPLEAVKAGRVTKPVEQAKATVKDIAKKASKKVQKPAEPESSDDDSGATSASSESSDEEVETKATPKTNGKVNGHAAKASDSESSEGADSDSEGSSDGSDSDEDEAPKVNGKAAAAADSADESDDDSDDSSEGSDSADEGKIDAKAGAKKAVDSDASDDDSSDASSSGSEDDSGDEEEEEEKPVAKDFGKKRKAEEVIEQTPKKTKATVDGELKDATPNLFVGNLSWNVDEEWLYREFETFGDLKNVRIITDRESGRSKGYGYVEFNTAEKAAEALEAMTGTQIDGRDVRVDFSVPRQNRNDGATPQQRSFDRAQKYGDTPREASATLFVGNISFNADESMVTELFEEYGTIKAVRLPTDRETGQPKGFGYVEYYTIDEAKAAYEALQGGDLSGRPMRLDYSTPRNNDSPASGGKWSRGGGDRGGFRGDRGGRGGRGGFGDRGRGGRGGARGGRGNFGTTNRGGFGDFSGKKISF